MVTIETIDIDRIRLDGGTQSRVRINPDTVDAYAQEMADGAEFPPVVVCFDGKEYWLADGFHRLYAALKVGAKAIRVEVILGTARDALLRSVGANTKQGLHRTNQDKRKAVTTLLTDSEWQRWTDVKIAEACGVTNRFVGMVREELSLNDSIKERFAERNGTVYPMRIDNIGENKKAAAEDAPSAELPAGIDGEIEIGTGQPEAELAQEVAPLSDKPEPAHFANLDFLARQEWISTTKDASTGVVGASILVALPEDTPINKGLQAFIKRAQDLNCSVFVTPNLRSLIETADRGHSDEDGDGAGK